MNKKFLATAVAFGVLGSYTAASWWFGGRTEDYFKEYLQSQPWRDDLEIVQRDYVRGVFSSRADTVLRMNMQGPGGQLELIFSQEISHGPLPLARLRRGNVAPVLALADSRLSLRLSEGAEAGPARKLFDNMVVEDHTVVHLDGRAASVFSSPAWQDTIESEQGPVTFSWEGFAGEGSYDSATATVTARGKGPGMQMTQGEGSFKVHGLSSQFEARIGESGVALGTFTSSMASMELVAAGKEEHRFQGTNLSLSGTTSESGETVAASQRLELESLHFDDWRGGPLRYELELRNIHSPTLLSIQKELRSLGAKSRQGDEASLAGGGELPALLLQLLARSPEIDIKSMSLETADGAVQAQALLTVAGDRTSAAPFNPLLLLNALSLQVSFGADETLLAKTAKTWALEQLQKGGEESGGAPLPEAELEVQAARLGRESLARLMQNGLLRLEDGKFQSSITLAEGRLQVNGAEIPLQQFFKK